MKKGLKLASVLAAAALALTACGSKGDDTNASASPSTSGTVKVGLAYDTGGKGDGSFNDSAYAGLQRVQSELGVEVKEVEASANATEASREELLRLLAADGYNPVIAVGYMYSGSLATVAAEFPDTTFAIVDSVVEGANIASLDFVAEQGSYIVGVIAASASKSGKIGFIGGQEIPLIKAFEAGYTQGAKSVNPDIQVQTAYMGPGSDETAWSVPDKAKTATAAMIDKGVDVAYAAAGGSGLGMLQALVAAGGSKKGYWGIGVDSDQYTVAAYADVKDVILTSMLKRVDSSVFAVVKSVVDGSPLTGWQKFDLARDGLSYSTSNPAVNPYKAAADAAAAKIKSGEIKVAAE